MAHSPESIIVATAADDKRPMAASSRVPRDTRTSVQYSELHSCPCSISYRTLGNAEQNGSAVLLSQMHSALRTPESMHRSPMVVQLRPSSTRSNTPCSSASRELEQPSHTA